MAYDETTARDAWSYAREQAALLLDTDLTTSEVAEAAMNLASAFRDLDTGTVTGTPVGGRAKAKLEERAESYASDARKFADMAEHLPAYKTPEDCERYAATYRTIAGELRKVAESL